MSSCVIVELSESEEWTPFRGCKRMPWKRMPTVLHPSRPVAEQEAIRLAREHPNRRFVIFEAAAAAVTCKIPTHITLGGTVVAERSAPTLVRLGEDDEEVPF